MRRDRRWAAWPLAVLLGTALALAPATGAAAYAMGDDVAGGSTDAVAGDAEERDDGPEDAAEPENAAELEDTVELEDAVDPEDTVELEDARDAGGSEEASDAAIDTEAELAVALGAGGQVVLDGSVTAASELVVEKDVTLDLNGHTLTAKIVVRGAELTVVDGSADQTGVLRGPSGEFPVSVEGACVIEGGLFPAEPPADFIAEGYEAVETEEGWSVVPEDPEAPEHQHALTWVPAVPATCTENGTAGHWACTGCGGLFSDEEGTQPVSAEDLAVPAAHELEAVAGRAQTCTEPGERAHWRCTVCGALFADAEAAVPTGESELAIPAGHHLEEVAGKAATCTETGRAAAWRCATCGALFADAGATREVTEDALVTPPTGHALVSVPAVCATCTDRGVRDHWRCATCGALFLDADGTNPTTEEGLATAALGHRIAYSGRVEPTTSTEGRRACWECSVCGALFADEGLTKPVTRAELAIPRLPTHTVTFDDQIKGTPSKVARVEPGDTVSRPRDPSLAGYEFEGWYVYDGALSEEPYDFDDPVCSDLVLRARWSELPELIPETGDALDRSAPLSAAALGAVALTGTVVLRRRAIR